MDNNESRLQPGKGGSRYFTGRDRKIALSKLNERFCYELKSSILKEL
ncbi:Uncharacterised protein [Escherichia coli]|nr:Uncharacterised protein [Escherichia coli]SQM88454.1 Uncharacterised protein [Escherichia coli]SQN27480.1 Uncharacterised protein [Escherichia coli]SQP35236.1 Uncharacterised protein [Escherichia coli]SQQ79530.1 Uncharacterised protein [Escherichia coli]